MNKSFEYLALLIFTGGVKNLADINNKGFTLRKNKTIVDINKAIKKSRKNGMGKTECELGMLEVYLKDIIKIRK